MIGWLRRRLHRRFGGTDAVLPDPRSLFVDLAGARGGLAYGEADRRRDFRSVFLGTAAGRRVLYEILAWSRVFASTFVPGDPHATHWREGGRDIGLRILALVDVERTAPGAGTDAVQPGAEQGERQ